MNAASAEVVHSLGIWVPVCAAALCAVHSDACGRRERARRKRYRALFAGTVRGAGTSSGSGAASGAGTPGEREPSRGRGPWRPSPRVARGVPGARGAREAVARWGEPVGAGLLVGILVGGATGTLAGVGAAAAVWRFRRTWRARCSGASGDSAEDRVAASRQLPLAADLLAACISAGAGPWQAAEAVGESLPGPVGARLLHAAAEIRLGGDPSLAWDRLGELPGAGPLARCLNRAGETGAPAAEPVARLADAIRAARADAAVAKAQRAGVLITAPVGLCFLPAFLSVGVAPVIVGLAGGLLHAG
ncbi:type II secretion system F family protein [Streptomyces sp. AM 2-1-1]|uniref:type II secretion system F family protein n=1 Tax=Streptomyces sp. AM 2-1-1 TaxID=3028709 RepID=UPI0023BA34B8|nr:type II secretion system F family protein [Streptomyces sp. AM 2-1-1]WEH40489.1 type II secretion system F family protein [Streptomyces sp. AM 2-1-1]